MFRRSFKNLVKKPSDLLEEMPLIAALTFENLEKEENISVLADYPIICKFCGGILVDYTKLKKTDGDEYKWKCEFCESENTIKVKDINTIEKITEEQKNKGLTAEELSILFQQISENKDEVQVGTVKKTGDALVAVIDISGSMSGGKLEAVKHSLIQTVKNIKINEKGTVFALITFTDDVRVYSQPQKYFRIHEDSMLFSKKNLRNDIRELLKNQKIGPLSEFAQGWENRINQLRTQGWTALGPGLYAGVILVQEKILKNAESNSRIILLTDGLANQGMGNVESTDAAKAKKFYQEVGNECLEDGITIDLVGVQSGNQVALDVVGVITDITGGEMILISQDQIETTFQKLSGKAYIARNTILRVFTPEGLVLDDITGTYVAGGIPKEAGEPIRLGSLDKDREIYLKFKQNREFKEDNIPIQIQMEYIDQDNNKKYRVARANVATTDAPDTYTTTYDAQIFSNMEMQEANEYMKNYDMKKARGKLKDLQSRLSSDAFEGAENISVAQELVQSEEEMWEEREEEAKARKVRDMKSFYASAGQSSSRMSINTRMKQLMKKKKKNDND